MCQQKQENTKKLYPIEKDSSVTVFVQDTVRKDSLSYPVLCDTCLTADLALDSVAIQYYKKEVDEVNLAKQIFTIKELQKDLAKEIAIAKSNLKAIKKTNEDYGKLKATVPSDSTANDNK